MGERSTHPKPQHLLNVVKASRENWGEKNPNNHMERMIISVFLKYCEADLREKMNIFQEQ